MKRNLLMIFLLLLSGNVLADSMPINFSFYGGVGFGAESEEVSGFDSTLEIDKGQGAVLSGTIGAKAHYYISDSLDFSVGLAYALRRADVVIIDSMSENVFAKSEIKREYLQLPFMLRWGQGLYLAVGGYLAFQLGDAREIKNDVALPASIQNKTDYGFLAEIGYRFDPMISLGANLEWGLVNVIEFPESFLYGYKMQNRQLSLFLQVELDLLN